MPRVQKAACGQVPHGARRDEDGPQPGGMRQEGGIEDGRAPAREQDVDPSQHVGILVELLSCEGWTLPMHEPVDFGQNLRGIDVCPAFCLHDQQCCRSGCRVVHVGCAPQLFR